MTETTSRLPPEINIFLLDFSLIHLPLICISGERLDDRIVERDRRRATDPVAAGPGTALVGFGHLRGAAQLGGRVGRTSAADQRRRSGRRHGTLVLAVRRPSRRRLFQLRRRCSRRRRTLVAAAGRVPASADVQRRHRWWVVCPIINSFANLVDHLAIYLSLSLFISLHCVTSATNIFILCPGGFFSI